MGVDVFGGSEGVCILYGVQHDTACDLTCTLDACNLSTGFDDALMSVLRDDFVDRLF